MRVERATACAQQPKPSLPRTNTPEKTIVRGFQASGHFDDVVRHLDGFQQTEVQALHAYRSSLVGGVADQAAPSLRKTPGQSALETRWPTQ